VTFAGGQSQHACHGAGSVSGARGCGTRGIRATLREGPRGADAVQRRPGSRRKPAAQQNTLKYEIFVKVQIPFWFIKSVIFFLHKHLQQK